MRFRKSAISAIFCIAALLPMTVIGRASTGAESRDVVQLTITFEVPDICRVNVGDQSFLMPKQDDTLLATLKPLVKKGRVLSIVGGMDIPYRCIGHTIYTAQRAGFKKVGFIAEPPAAK